MLVFLAMTPGLIIPALFFLAVAVALLAFIVRPIIGAFGNPTRWLANRPIKQKQQLLLQFDRYLQVGDLATAFKILKHALILKLPADSLQMAAANTHNYKVLDRLVSAAEKKRLSGDGIKTLEKLERLLSDRNEQLASYGTIVSTAQKINDKTEGAKQKSGRWAIAEYQKKLKQAKKELDTNRKQTERCFASCLLILQRSQGGTKETYH